MFLIPGKIERLLLFILTLFIKGTEELTGHCGREVLQKVVQAVKQLNILHLLLVWESLGDMMIMLRILGEHQPDWTRVLGDISMR
jgi:hypothetical protein